MPRGQKTEDAHPHASRTHSPSPLQEGGPKEEDNNSPPPSNFEVTQAEAGFQDDFIVIQEEEGAEYNSPPPSTFQVSQGEENIKDNFLLVAQEPEGFQDDIVVIQEERGAEGNSRPHSAMQVFNEEDMFILSMEEEGSKYLRRRKGWKETKCSLKAWLGCSKSPKRKKG